MSESVLLSDAAPVFEDVDRHEASPLTEAEVTAFEEIVSSIQAGEEAPERLSTDGLSVPFALGLLANARVQEAKHDDPARTLVPSTSPYVTKYTTNPTGGSPSIDDQDYNDYD